jgi:hypothetical protein
MHHRRDQVPYFSERLAKATKTQSHASRESNFRTLWEYIYGVDKWVSIRPQPLVLVM